MSSQIAESQSARQAPMPERIEWTIETCRLSYWPYFLGSILFGFVLVDKYCERRKKKTKDKAMGHFDPAHIVWKLLHFNSLYLQIVFILRCGEKIKVRADAVSI